MKFGMKVLRVDYFDSRKVQLLDLIATFFLSIFIIVAQYRSALDVASYGLLGAYILSVAYITKTKTFPFYKPLLVMAFGYIFLESYNLFLRDTYLLTIVNRSFAPLLMIASVACFARLVSMRRFIKYYEIVVWISCVGVSYHAFEIVFGRSVSIINIFPGYDYGDFNRVLDRPLSFFTEPQAFSSFVLPLFGCYLVRRAHYRVAFLFVFLVISTSSFGILCGLLLIGFYVLTVSEAKVTAFFSMVVCALLGGVGLTSTDLGSQALDKIINTDFETSIRLSKGFLVFKEFDEWAMLFGTDKSTSEFIVKNLGAFEWALPYVGTDVEELLEYLSSFSYVLVNFGLLGVFLYVAFFGSVRKYAITPYGKILLFLIIISNFVNTILFNAWFVFYYAVFFSEYESVSVKRVALKPRF